MPIRQIFSDMDGTLLNSQGLLAQSNADLILQANIPVTLVSARAPIEMAPAIKMLHLTGPQIAFNGGLIFRPNAAFDPLVAHPMSHDSVATLLDAIETHFPKVSLSFYDRKQWYTSRIDRGIEYEQSLTEQAPELVVTDSAAAAGLEVFKLMMITFDLAEMNAMNQFLLDLKVPGVSIQRSGDQYLEITSDLAKKSYGIQYLFDHTGLVPSDCAAFGDGHNDLPMLRRVGTPIAMANAQQVVLDLAAYTTTSNDEDGVGRGIHDFLLK